MITIGQIRVSCIDCHEDMHIEYQDISHDTDEILLFVGCKCGRRAGMLSGMRIRRKRYDDPNAELRFASSDIEPLNFDSGAFGKELVERGRNTMLRGERYIAAATWMRSS